MLRFETTVPPASVLFLFLCWVHEDPTPPHELRTPKESRRLYQLRGRKKQHGAYCCKGRGGPRYGRSFKTQSSWSWRRPCPSLPLLPYSSARLRGNPGEAVITTDTATNARRPNLGPVLHGVLASFPMGTQATPPLLPPHRLLRGQIARPQGPLTAHMAMASNPNQIVLLTQFTVEASA